MIRRTKQDLHYDRLVVLSELRVTHGSANLNGLFDVVIRIRVDEVVRERDHDGAVDMSELYCSPLPPIPSIPGRKLESMNGQNV